MSFGQNLLQLVFRQVCETRNLQFFFNSALFLLLVGSGPKRSMPILQLGSYSHVFPNFTEKENCTAAQKTTTMQPGKKKCSRHLIYAQACVNKDFDHSGSIGLV